MPDALTPEEQRALQEVLDAVPEPEATPTEGSTWEEPEAPDCDLESPY